MKNCALFLMVFVALFMFATNAFSVPANRQLPFMAGETWWCSQDWYINEDPYTHLHEAAWIDTLF